MLRRSAFANGQVVTADYVILTLPVAVLRTIDYSKAGFDALKTTAITQYGGRSARYDHRQERAIPTRGGLPGHHLAMDWQGDAVHAGSNFGTVI
jgi:hypothetical protein